MKYLLDTHLLLWAALSPQRLSKQATDLIVDPEHELYFSPVGPWEVAIKNSLGRPDFQVDPHLLRRGLRDNGYIELPILGQHAVAVANLPPIHRDPFDRMLVAQATVEGMTLLTSDETVASYPGPVRLV